MGLHKSSSQDSRNAGEDLSDPHFQRAREVSNIALPSHVIGALRDKLDAEARDRRDANYAAERQYANLRRDDATRREVKSQSSNTRRPRGHAPLFDLAVAKSALSAAEAGRTGVDRVSLSKKLLKHLVEQSPFRRIAKPAKSWRTELDELASNYPNAMPLRAIVCF